MPGMSPRKKFTFSAGHQAALQLDATKSQQTTDIKAGLEMGKGKPQADITLRVRFSGDMQSQHKCLYLIKIKCGAKQSFIFDLIFSLALHSPAYQYCAHPLLQFNSEKWPNYSSRKPINQTTKGFTSLKWQKPNKHQNYEKSREGLCNWKERSNKSLPFWQAGSL